MISLILLILALVLTLTLVDEIIEYIKERKKDNA